MKILENNYVPKEIEVQHIGYRQICDNCKSVIVVEQSETKFCRCYDRLEYQCPCCKTIQKFYTWKDCKEEWIEKVLE